MKLRFTPSRKKTVARCLGVLLTLFALSSASAQSDTFVGGSFDLEFIGGGTFVALDGQFGDYGLFNSFGARATLGIGFIPEIYAKIVGDVLFPFQTTNRDLFPYAGGGLGIDIDDGVGVNIHALGGVELAASDRLGLFGEVAPGILIRSDVDAIFGLRFGLNYHLN